MSREIFSKDAQEFNTILSVELKKMPEFKKPVWMDFVKTGLSKKRVPEDEDFWFKRGASILRQLYINGVVGVERLRTRYGGRKNRGVRPARFKKSSGKIIRVLLQQAEKAGLVEKVADDQFGRRLTKKGREFLDSIKTSEKTAVALESYLAKPKTIKVEQYEIQDGTETQSAE